LSVEILTLWSDDEVLEVSFITYKLYIISSYTSSIVALVWGSIIKRKMFLEIIGHITEVDNKLLCTLQEETYMNRNVLINIISETIMITIIMVTLYICHV
jgi:hypothetical protein